MSDTSRECIVLFDLTPYRKRIFHFLHTNKKKTICEKIVSKVLFTVNISIGLYFICAVTLSMVQSSIRRIIICSIHCVCGFMYSRWCRTSRVLLVLVNALFCLFIFFGRVYMLCGFCCWCVYYDLHWSCLLCAVIVCVSRDLNYDMCISSIKWSRSLMRTLQFEAGRFVPSRVFLDIFANSRCANMQDALSFNILFLVRDGI